MRGTAWDVFGYSAERRSERALITRYEENISTALAVLERTRDSTHHDAAVALACLPEQIRGYGHVRAKTLEPTRERENELLEALQRRVIVLRQAA